jgi:hypothetical protein
MCKPKRKILLIASSALALALLLGVGYAYQRSRFLQKSNALFDPHHKAFHGLFLPWPLGRPTLVGSFDPDTDRRLRAALGYESGGIRTNGLQLIMHDSDGTFFVHAN